MIERLVSRLGFQEAPYAMAVGTFAVVLVVFPNGYRAAIPVKQDVRGIAEDIAALVANYLCPSKLFPGQQAKCGHEKPHLGTRKTRNGLHQPRKVSIFSTKQYRNADAGN